MLSSRIFTVDVGGELSFPGRKYFLFDRIYSINPDESLMEERNDSKRCDIVGRTYVMTSETYKISTIGLLTTLPDLGLCQIVVGFSTSEQLSVNQCKYLRVNNVV